MRSIRSCSRARTTERGFALVWAVGLAILYFLLIELMLIDSARELAEARRFRAKVIAATLAENGAELAAEGLVNPSFTQIPVQHADWQGTCSGAVVIRTADGRFTLKGDGQSSGTDSAKGHVVVEGKVDGTRVRVYYTRHPY